MNLFLTEFGNILNLDNFQNVTKQGDFYWCFFEKEYYVKISLEDFEKIKKLVQLPIDINKEHDKFCKELEALVAPAKPKKKAKKK